MDLGDHKDTLAKNLSGGQKRKLCVGMALVGNPKVTDEVISFYKRNENIIATQVNS